MLMCEELDTTAFLLRGTAFEIERNIFDAAGVTVFSRRMKDLHGSGTRTIPDQMFPYSYADNIAC